MTLAQLKELEDEMIKGLRERAAKGDNEAAGVLLAHLRATSVLIEEWRKNKQDAERAKGAPTPR